MPEWDAKTIELLIAELASEDSFARLRAVEQLVDLTHQSLGFRFNAPPAERDAALKRWKAWLKEQQREREKKAQLKAAVKLSGGVIDINALKQAVQGIPAEKIQGYLNALISKMKSHQNRCEACGSRPATVTVTELKAGRYHSKSLCDLCAKERGDILF
jgi:hypothetical protein